MSSLWEVPAYLIMAFSLALDAPVEKASRDLAQQPLNISSTANFEVSRGIEMPEVVWLRAVKTAAPHSDVLRSYANRIFITSSGTAYVPNDTDRKEIRSLQTNGEVVTRVIVAATRANKTLLSGLGNNPTPGALLVAHVYGIATAQRFCAALERDPEALAVEILPELREELQQIPLMTVSELEAKLTALATGRAAVPRFNGAERRNKAWDTTVSVDHLKGTVTQSDPRTDRRIARAR